MKDCRRIRTSLIFLMAAMRVASAQTQVDLATQSKNVDFSRAISTKPAQVGPTIPSVCSTGQIFFDSSAASGQNLYGCTSTNIWSPLGSTGSGSGGGPGTASQLGDFIAANLSSTVQTVGAGCSNSTPCQVRIGTVLFTMTAPVTVTLSGTINNGTVFWYLSSLQALTVGHNSGATLTCSSGCSVVTGITTFPPDSVPLWQTTFTANVWDPINLPAMDQRAIYSRDVIAPGSGVSSTSNPSTGVQTLSTDPTQVPRYFAGPGAPALSCTAGRDFYTDTTGLNLYFCDAANTWKQASGGGASRFTDFLAVDTSATVQSIGGSCSSSAPCQIRLGTQVFTMTAPVTATLSGTSSSGTVYWYLSSAQVLTAGHNSSATLTCSTGCSVATGITAFPTDSVPLWQTTFTANVWDPIVLSTMDKRAVYSRVVIAAGNGISSNISGGIQTLSTDPTQSPRYFTGSGAPALSCTAGRDFYTDTTGLNLYFCDATNTWKLANSSGPALSGSQIWFPMLSPNPVLNTSTRGSTTYTSSTAYYMQLWTPVALTVKSVTPLVDTGAAGAFGDIALFDSTCTKIAGSDANFSAANTGSYPTVTLGSTITIPAGIFYYSWALTSATAALDASVSISSAQGPWYFAAGASQSIGTLLSFTGSNPPIGSGTSFALPSTCGTKTINSTTNVPITLVIQ